LTQDNRQIRAERNPETGPGEEKGKKTSQKIPHLTRQSVQEKEGKGMSAR